ncbi:hypothetical protein GCM10007352_07210 [Mucilaginibacter phyllosphaerae]|nr:hypothetical protein GCM10007352_07210 [Mucilaginibacter phyllosphaerae]
MYCVVVKAQTVVPNGLTKNDATASIEAKATTAGADAVKPVMYNITVQNNTGCCTYQIQIVPQFSGGTNASFNFTSSQTVSLVAGLYTIYMRGPGQNYRFAYQICATSGSITGPNATFSSVNICSDGIISVNN